MAKKRYQVQLKASVEKAYAKLPDKAKKRIAGRLRSLEDDPRPPGVKKLEGADGLYRIREGDFRIVYTIEDGILLVLVLKIGDRKDVYREL